jgi:uncharacterized protein
MQNEAIKFLDKLFIKLADNGLDISSYPIDHLCYRTSSEENYQKSKNYFSEKGKLLIESLVGGRMIATYKLDTPLIYRHFQIPLIEVPAPKAFRINQEGFEHIEVVISESFAEFKRKYPHIRFLTHAEGKEINPDIEIDFGDCAIKFHHQSLEEVIRYESQL